MSSMNLSAHHPVRRRARTERSSILPRSLFRNQRRRRQSQNLSPFDAPISSEPTQPSHSSSFLQRHRHRRQPEPQPKPIYIYPGLLRIVRDKAIALDNQCPALLYKCRECRREQKQPSRDTLPPGLQDPIHPPSPEVDNDQQDRQPAPVKCPHQTACAICLEEFHGKDLVRKLPCNPNHIFHSKCILDWFVSHHRCPLCNEQVTNTVQARFTAHYSERRASSPMSQSAPDLGAHQIPHPAYPHPYHHDHEHHPMDHSNHIPGPARDPSRAPPMPQPRPEVTDNRSKRNSNEKGRKKQRGPRTYSYIAHDSVRMEMNPVIPV